MYTHGVEVAALQACTILIRKRQPPANMFANPFSAAATPDEGYSEPTLPPFPTLTIQTWYGPQVKSYDD